MNESSNPKKPSKASLSKGRKSLCVIFRHPLRPGPDGKAGLRVRRGLGTDDEAEALRLVEQLNVLLANTEWHNPGAEQAARAQFPASVVSAFYDKLMPESSDPWQIRENLIPLPSKENGYCRVRLIGITGAGKTTMLRQLIGTTLHERFPSTSTAKTTTSEIEVVLQPGEFKGVVTFIPRDHVRLYIEECALRAAVTSLNKPDDASIAEDLLEHTEQRFRLKYLLGNLKTVSASLEDELSDDEDETEADEMEVLDSLSEDERKTLEAYLTTIVNRIRTVAQGHMGEIETELGYTLSEANRAQRGDMIEHFEHVLQTSADFQEIVDDLLDSVDRRFEMFNIGEFKNGSAGWPEHWTFKTTDRAAFLDAVRWFSSNYAGHFGRLLTPLVSGIRVAGPFQCPLAGTDQKLVIMDGEGLGHAAATVTSISTEITKRHSLADTILLVDNAAQPMQSAPCAVVKNLLVSGQDHKLAIVFTHFDQVKGLNLPDVPSRKQHLLGSVHNAVEAVAEGLGDGMKATLRDHLEHRVFFLSNIQNEVGSGARLTRSEFSRIFEIFRHDIKPVTPSEIHPVYDEANLILALQSAISQFRDPWRGRLGLSSKSGLKKEHFGRIKALARRFAHFGSVEYDTLQPVADLLERLKERLTVFLGKPAAWIPASAPEELQREAIAPIQRELAEKLMDYSIGRLRDDHIADWLRAYGHDGTGSATLRARDIEGIFNESAPLLGETPDEWSIRLVDDVRKIFRESVKVGGGTIKGHE
jgi:hypothetical protein